MKLITNAALLSFTIVIGAYFYFKYQETDYDYIIATAAKRQRDFSEFVIFYGEIEPAIPEKATNLNTVYGIDNNGNGVRDDIDVWINRTAYNQNETKAMRQYAKSNQELFKICEKNDLKFIKIVNEKIFKAEKCLISHSDYQRREQDYAKDKLNILLFNTNARKSCKENYLRQDEVKSINGDINFHCNFDLQYPDNVIFGINEWKKLKRF